MAAIAAAILAGGENSRMGARCKAFIRVNGAYIIDRMISVLDNIFEEILIVVKDEAGFMRYKNSCIVTTDIIKGRGPLGGLHAALTCTSKDGVFLSACDMPYLHNGAIRRLADAFGSGGYDCVCPETGRGIEPLHAVYSVRMLPGIERILTKEDNSMTSAISRFRCRRIRAEESERASFININTKEELDKINAA
ncbi:molybdenum cofactor guanylyltransferase [Candidatus Omnitrophota bacterium]